jgi:hypothetical protein
MKEYQDLIGKVIIAAAIVIAAGIIGQALNTTGAGISNSINYLAELIRDGL